MLGSPVQARVSAGRHALHTGVDEACGFQAAQEAFEGVHGVPGFQVDAALGQQRGT